MFVVVRSLFWLTVAYMVIKPGVPLPDPAELSAQAMAAGSRVVAEQIANIPCDTLACTGGKVLVATTLSSSPQAGDPMHVDPASVSVPLPRVRPNAAG